MWPPLESDSGVTDHFARIMNLLPKNNYVCGATWILDIYETVRS